MISTPVVAALVAVVGWLVSHLFAIRAQRQALRNQIINTARESVVAQLREYQDWLSEMVGWTAKLENAQMLHERHVAQNWVQIGQEALAVIHDRRSLAWVLALEEYEMVFPETREVRRYLLDQQRDVVSAKTNELFYAIHSDQERARLFNTHQFGVYTEQSSLVEYLRVHIQNLSLGRLLGKRQPVPEPTVPGLTRLELRDGMIRVVLSDAESAKRGTALQGPVNLSTRRSP